MNMECQRYGNPHYERSPSPERVKAEQERKAERERVQREDEFDVEEEKRLRAQNLDPAIEALAMLMRELRTKLLEDVKSRVVAPSLYDYLEPDRHSAKRRKLGIADPDGNKRATVAIDYPDDTVGTPDARARRGPGNGAGLDILSLPRIRKAQGVERGNTAFMDERRRMPPKRKEFRPLYHRLQQLHEDEESDDERRTSVTRDTEDQESRITSRMSVVDDSDDEKESIVDSVLPDESVSTLDATSEAGDLEALLNVINKLPASSKKRKRLIGELESRKRLKGTHTPAPGDDLQPVDILITPPEDDDISATKKKGGMKQTKDEVFEEQVLPVPLEEKVDEDLVEVADESEEESLPGEEEANVQEVEWGVSRDEPRPTVEDDDSMLLDLDGWQNIVKDDEDMRFLREALANEQPASYIVSAPAWAWRQKEIKAIHH
ncbi:histone methyltransferase set1, partial [Ascosphaera atra]